MKGLRKKATGLMALAMAGILLAGCAANAPANPSAVQTGETQDDAAYLETLTPATDYFGYINAEALMETELKSTQEVIGTLAEIANQVEDEKDEILDEILQSKGSYEKGSTEQMIRDTYDLVYNQLDGKTDVDASDTAFIDGVIAEIDSVKTMDELWKLWNHLSVNYGFDGYMLTGVETNLYENTEYILKFEFDSIVDMEEMMDRQLYAMQTKDKVVAELKVLGVPSEEAEERAINIIYMIYEIAAHTDFDIVNEEKEAAECSFYYTREEFEKAFPGIAFDSLVSSAGVEGTYNGKVMLKDPEQFTAIVSVTDEEHLQAWKDITLYKFLNVHASWMPLKYNFAQNADRDPDKTARSIVKSYYSEGIGELYRDKYFTEEMNKTVTKMCEDMRAEYRVLIGNADWLSEEGRAFLLKKLNNMNFFVGGGAHYKPDPEMEDIFASSVLVTEFNADAYFHRKFLQKLGTKNDRNHVTGIDASTVNAFYSPDSNCIIITTGILKAPVYDDHADYMTNLGGIGAVVGHEISHGFDSQGVNFDENGNYRPESMPEADREAFKAIQQKTIDYYSTFSVLGSRVNGKKTLGENLADLSGVQCILAIAKTPENQKKVLENYAVFWRNLMTDSYAKESLDDDVHAPGKVRVNAVVSCFDEYYEIYGVKEGDPMYVPPEERIRRW